MKRSWLLAVCALGCSSEAATGGNAGGATIADASHEADVHAPDAATDAAKPDVYVPPFDGPDKLSQTGLYAEITTRTLAPGVMPFSVRFPLWSDGADKQRWLLLPEGTQIDTSAMDLWKFPIGTKAWKEFSLAGQTLETRLLEKRADGWLMVSYLWNDEGTDANVRPLGAKDVLGTGHDVPSQEDCTQCHGGAGDVLVGVSAIQLSTEGGTGFITELSLAGKLSNPPAAEFPVPGDGIVEQTIGYLHGNCGQCHNDQHFLASTRQLRLKLTVDALTPETTPLYTTAPGALTDHVIDGTTIVVVPGKPLESQLFVRMNRRDLLAMPPLGSEIVDDPAVAAVEQWITSLSP